VLKVGLTGGLASGKSTVGRILKDLGCHLFLADEAGHRLLAAGGEAVAPVRAAFGEAILSENGEIDRRKLGQIVFADPDALNRLNAIIHPLVFACEDRWLESVQSGDPQAVAVVEAAILIETGSYRRFDKLIVSWCPLETALVRAMARSGWPEAEARQRLARQMPIEEKKSYADYLIDTSGSMAETIEQTKVVYAALRSASL
jgi:dephospho-CoA kinase